MSNVGLKLATDSSSAGELHAPSSAVQMRWLELGLVLLCTIVPSIVTSIFLLRAGGLGSNFTDARYTSGALHEVGGLCLLAYVLKRSGRDRRTLGLQFKWGDVGIGILLLLGALAVSVLVAMQSQMIAAGLGRPALKSANLTQMVQAASPWMLFLFATLNPWYEELVVRAFLMTEIVTLTGSTWLAIGLSTVVQASYHLYQGWFNATVIAGMFLVFSLYYAKTRKIFPVIIAHMLQDYSANWRMWHHLHPR